jgi:hypothetical protein
VIVLVIALAWLLVSVVAALVVGGSIRIADRRAPEPITWPASRPT